jgi:calcium-dependent protein kinase
VYKVKHLCTDEERACKEVPLNTVADIQYGKAELLTMIHLEHPNVVKLFDFFEDEFAFYLICEFCDGGDFGTLVRSEPVESPKDLHNIKFLYLDIFKGLAYCHNQDIVHRDIKYHNCMIQPLAALRQKSGLDVIGKLIDFGLAGIRKESDEMRWMNEICGTKLYMSPMVAEKSTHYGRECDIWALGVMLYMTVTDEHPVTNSTLGPRKFFLQKLEQYKAMRMEPMSTNNIPPSLVSLLQRLLEKDVGKRLTAQQAQGHPFFQYDDAEQKMEPAFTSKTKGLVKRSLQGAQAFSRCTAFEKALRAVVIYRQASKEVEALQGAFMQLDRTGNGTISEEELREGINKCRMNMTSEAVAELHGVLDADGTGQIHFNEFLTAVLRTPAMATDQAIDDVFEVFDQDGDGKVEYSELCQVLGEESKAVEALASAQAKCDYLTKEDFAKLMKSWLTSDDPSCSSLSM